jgi:hypothetical protein
MAWVRNDSKGETKPMTPIRKGILAVTMVGSSLVGGAIGAAMFAGSSANAASTQTTTPPTAAPSTTAPKGPAGSGVTGGGTFHSNEDPTHEAGESAAREAQENAGQRPTVP